MKIGCDPVLLLLVLVLFASLVAFITDVFVYPFGLLVLIIAITARVLYLRSGSDGRH